MRIRTLNDAYSLIANKLVILIVGIHQVNQEKLKVENMPLMEAFMNTIILRVSLCGLYMGVQKSTFYNAFERGDRQDVHPSWRLKTAYWSEFLK